MTKRKRQEIIRRALTLAIAERQDMLDDETFRLYRSVNCWGQSVTKRSAQRDVNDFTTVLRELETL